MTIKRFLVYIVAFAFSVAIALGLLAASAFLPQDAINKHIQDSADQIMMDSTYVGDRSDGAKIDITSESIMFIECKSLTRDDMSSILLNPRVTYAKSEANRENLLYYAYDEAPDNTINYSRYWMGFRVPLRLALVKLDYWQMRRCTAYLFFFLFAAVVCSLAKHTSSKIAMSFALSLVFVNPHVISLSFQSFTCFCIAFIAMLAVPWVHRHPKWEHLFFMEIGIATMYFDFYTTPVITLGLPLLYLYLLHFQNGAANRPSNLVKNILAWFCGYGFMWLAKLVLTDIFTNEEAIRIAFHAFLDRTDLKTGMFSTNGYGLFSSLYMVLLALVSERDGAILLLSILVLIFAAFLVQFIKNRLSIKTLVTHWQILLIASVPVLWFFVVSRPTVIHHYFQYRGILVTLWAGICYLYCTAIPKKTV